MPYRLRSASSLFFWKESVVLGGALSLNFFSRTIEPSMQIMAMIPSPTGAGNHGEKVYVIERKKSRPMRAEGWIQSWNLL